MPAHAEHAAPPTALPTAPAAYFPPVTKTLAFFLAGYIVIAVTKTNSLVPAVNVAMPGKLFAGLVLLAALACPLRARLDAINKLTITKAVYLVAFLMAASVPLSLWPGNSFGYFRDQGVQTFFLFVVAAIAFSDRRVVPMLSNAWVLGAGLGAVRMLLPGAIIEQDRVTMSMSFDSNESAALIVSTLPFALWMATRRGWGRIVGTGLSLAMVIATVKTGSRGGLFGLLGVGLVMLYTAPPKRRLSYFVAAVVGGMLVSATASASLRDRMKSIFSDNTETEDYNFTAREGRIAIWKRGIHYMVTHPLLGVGVDAFETAEGTISGMKNDGFGLKYNAAHNSFVQIGAELGVFGLLGYSTAMFGAGIGTWRVRKRSLEARLEASPLAEYEVGYSAAALQSLVGLLVTGFFLSFGYHPITLFVLAVCVGVIAGTPFGTVSTRGGLAETPAARSNPSIGAPGQTPAAPGLAGTPDPRPPRGMRGGLISAPGGGSPRGGMRGRGV